MTAAQFESFWHANYPGSVPLAHLFKFYFRHRWFRIPSISESKRYPSNKHEWERILRRQNEIITDLIGNNSNLWGLTGEYGIIEDYEKPQFITKGLLSQFSFVELNPIDMHRISEAEFKMGEIYKPFITTLTWQSNKFNDLLKAIAKDDRRMFFICLSPKCLIAPYDGGIDFVLENSQIKNTLERKYKEWMSAKIENL